MKMLGAVVAVMLAGCAAGPTATGLQPSDTPAPTAAPTVAPTSAPSVPPSVSSPPTAAPTAPAATTPYDGIWASEPLTRADMAAALEAREMSTANLDTWWTDWDEIDYRIFEIEITDGRWLLHENAEGIEFGIAWAGELELRDPDTIVASDDEFQCPVTYDLVRSGDELSITVADDDCPEAEDLPIQVTIYESASFHLVQAADWAPPHLAVQAPVPSGPSTSRTRQTLQVAGTVGGTSLGYVEYLPPDYSEQGPKSPLLVFFHGSGESGAGDLSGLLRLTTTAIPSLVANSEWPDDRPFVVLSPQHEEVAPSYCFEADEIHEFLQFAIEHYNVDPARIYATGLSCGAIGLWNYVGAHGNEVLAAMVPIAGYGIGAVERQRCALGQLPIWAFHGGRDENVFVRGDVYPIETLQRCPDPGPVDARVTVFPAFQHDVWTRTYDGSAGYDIYDWMLSHHK